MLGKPRYWPYVWGENILSPPEHERFQRLIDRRATGYPIAYLTGERAFWSFDLLVTEDVLIPRPETECLVQTALDIIPKGAKWRVADLGTGAGPVALALARERPNCRVTATDLSAAALRVAKRNARKHKIGNVAFQEGSWFDAFRPDAPANGMDYHLIVSNPPYVAMEDPHLLEGDVRFEPALALVGGPDGCDAIGHIAHGARKHLGPGGWLILEHGYDQGKQVRALLGELDYCEVKTRRDYGEQDRITLGSVDIW
uniref:Release factor glutamine methyltransferase n=1 Tax=Candidatus Kentrum eta TaxID=2126337 RepID=A0A450VSI1_9GAMM|nr:MAG: release factor glutamine methyltransferase [Candidatus Kentron sp. H]VFK04830.1 MAG: release factor glutamine methyltransferase [Candidatus Kentron sp. H]VFK07741.1 MAG: release factor glutamine methyltransferase [Candidatus Kentron sp. H]